MRFIGILLVLASFQSFAQQTKTNYAFNDSLPAYPAEKEIEYRIKFYLAEKYTPGSCYGMPSPRTYDLDRITNYHIHEASYVKSRLDMDANDPISRKAIAIKLKQFYKIKLTKTSDGYFFEFVDGNCCRITTVKGSIAINQDKISDTITSKQTKHVPC